MKKNLWKKENKSLKEYKQEAWKRRNKRKITGRLIRRRFKALEENIRGIVHD